MDQIGVERASLFRRTMYSEEDYEDDMDSKNAWWRWEEAGNDYDDLQRLIAQISRKQGALLANRSDHSALVAAVPRFSNLQQLGLVVLDSTDPDSDIIHPCIWEKKAVNVPSHVSSSYHLCVCLDALMAAKDAGIKLESLECDLSGLLPLGECDPTLGVLVTETLSNLSDLEIFYRCNEGNSSDKYELPSVGYRLILQAASNSLKRLFIDPWCFIDERPTLKTVCTGITLSSLQKLKLQFCDLDIDGFEDFLLNRAPKLTSLVLRDVGFRSDGVSTKLSNTASKLSKAQIEEYLSSHMQCLVRVANATRLTNAEVRDDDWRGEGERECILDCLIPFRMTVFEKILLHELDVSEAKKLVVMRVKPKDAKSVAE
jgi:hypothetical protein